MISGASRARIIPALSADDRAATSRSILRFVTIAGMAGRQGEMQASARRREHARPIRWMSQLPGMTGLAELHPDGRAPAGGWGSRE